MTVKRLRADIHASPETGGLCRFIYSETECFSPHCHEYYEIFLTVEGEVTHFVNGAVQRLQRGDLVFIRPDDVHNYQYSPGDTYRFVNLAFDKATAQIVFSFIDEQVGFDALTGQTLPPVVRLEAKECQWLYEKFLELNTIEVVDKKTRKLNIRLLILQIFVKYFLSGTSALGQQPPLWLEKAVDEMRVKENFVAGAKRMLALSGKSKEHLSRCMKKYYATTVSEYINAVRLNYAANMLHFSNLSVLDICFESGFQNSSWFYHLFREKFGVSPNQFRKNHSAQVRKFL